MLPWTFLPAEFTVSLLSMVLGFVSRLCEGVARRASCEQTASGWSVGCACHHPNICADPGRSMGCAFRHPALNHAWCSCELQGTSSTSNVLIWGSSCIDVGSSYPTCAPLAQHVFFLPSICFSCQNCALFAKHWLFLPSIGSSCQALALLA